jgi:hypothetical protein
LGVIALRHGTKQLPKPCCARNCLVGIITWENLLEDLLVAQARGRKRRVAARPALAG